MSNNTHPLPQDAPQTATSDPAVLIAQHQSTLEGSASNLKALALSLNDQKLSAGLLRAADEMRRRSMILSTYVQDLQNEATRQALESGLELPPDVAPPPLFGSEAPPSASLSGQPTQAFKVGGFLQEQ